VTSAEALRAAGGGVTYCRGAAGAGSGGTSAEALRAAGGVTSTEALRARAAA
jgi:hypothetical protein